MKLYIIIFLFVSTQIHSQISKDTLFIKYDDKMHITNDINTLNEIKVNLSFAIGSKGNARITTYNFFIDNLNKDFKELRFEEIKDSITPDRIDPDKVFDLSMLKNLNACEQYFLLADTKPIILIKKKDDHFLRYTLLYWSTQRGWQ